MKIYIPTYKRVDRQITWDGMPPILREDTTLVVSHEEASAHSSRGRQVLISPDQGKGMAAIRGWIVRHAQKMGQRYIAILDDDLVLQIRKGGKIVRSGSLEQDQAFQWMYKTLKTTNIPVVAFGVRFLDYATEEPHVDCTRAMQAIGVNTATLKALNINFDTGVPPWFPMDDFNLSLGVLTKGHRNRVSLLYRTNPASANAPGGCSEQRTLERQNEAAKILQNRYPRYVTLRKKKAWQGMEGEMLDVTVQWKRAYKEA